MDILPEFCQKRILILGCGNTLFGDDGFGPEVVSYLLHNYEVPNHVCIMDVGTGVRKVLFTLALSETRPEEIVVIDAVDWGGQPGEVFEIPIEAIPKQKVDNFSMHQAPTSNLLQELREQCGVRVTVLACDVGPVPSMVQPGLSEAVREAVPVACHKIVEKYFNVRNI
ncbi:MAG: hydrogenase maturation protease [Anaerolineae bacterium]